LGASAAAGAARARTSARSITERMTSPDRPVGRRRQRRAVEHEEAELLRTGASHLVAEARRDADDGARTAMPRRVAAELDLGLAVEDENALVLALADRA